MISPSSKISSIKGIGPKKEKLFNHSGLYTIEDLIYFFPRSYQDRREVTAIGDLKPGEESLIVGKVIGKKIPSGFYRKNSPLSILVKDQSGEIEIVFFNGRFLSSLFEMNKDYSFFGKISTNYSRLQMIHPEFSKNGSKDDIRGVIPIYPKIPGVSQKEIRRIQTELKPIYSEIEDWIPESIIKDNKLADLKYSLENLHFPKEVKSVLAAKFRMVFGEMLVMETGLNYMRQGEKGITDGISFSCSAGDSFAKGLPFSLTEGQKKAWESIKKDLESNKRMNRLLQGDVGSGKTVIAQMAMYSATKSGYQSVIMAPTEILAKQHFETFSNSFSPLGIEPKLLISSMNPSEKKRILKDLEEGNLSMLIATHAVLQENVKFSNLGLVITDEQHRFGVNQRRKLSEKGAGVNALVMTATPIPRTLAVILYGDLDSSQIRTTPKGRKPVKTTLCHSEERHKVYSFVEEKIREGRQAYVVAPLIGDSDRVDASSAEGIYKELDDKYTPRGIKIALIHGSMKQEEKDVIMEAFSKGEIDILVSTVVIEVGINVPNAAVMVIENAERFGLAQLHQLRGRVGRGVDESYCFLISDSENEIAQKRGEIMCKTNDGFEIAEEDMVLRGPGEIFGTKQHGVSELILSDVIKHIDVLEKANEVAKEILKKDPSLSKTENWGIKKRVRAMFGEEVSLYL